MPFQPLSRRRFLQTVPALAGINYLACRAAAESKAPSGKLRIAIIGVAGRGGDNLNGVKGESIAALCDIDDNQLQRAAGKFPDAKTHRDFRELLEDPKGIDAVVVSTPDHQHAPAAVRAMRKGLHVYSEKPLGHTVWEARLMRETYLERKDKIATQMGTQIHAEDNYRRVVELVQAGAVGNVTEAHVWCDRKSSQNPAPQGSTPVPPNLNWDLWVGPAPFRPYQKGYMPGNLTWNRFWDIGNGILGDMGSHLIDLPFWALALKHPTTIEADAPAADPVIYPTKLQVTWQHPKRGEGPHQQPCKVVWYDGHAKPSKIGDVDVAGYPIGVLFVGDKGKLLADYGKRKIIVPEGQAQPAAPPASIPKSLGHHAEWLAACKGNPAATLCNFGYSGLLIEHNMLGVVAHRAGKKLEWNPAQLEATNAPEAGKFINKQYREGWGFGKLA